MLFDFEWSMPNRSAVEKVERRAHREALRLRDLVLVVREHQVDAPGVDIHGVPEVTPCHSTALDVPPRPPLAERSIPNHVPIFRFVRLSRGFSRRGVSGRGGGQAVSEVYGEGAGARGKG